MEDILTETPPPSRFHQDDLDNFAPPSPPIPSPFLSLSASNSGEPLRPSTLIVAVSDVSILTLHRLFPSKTLIGTLTLPEIRFSGGNSLDSSSLFPNSINIYGVGESVALVLARALVLPERSHAVAAALFGSRISPERAVIFDSLRRTNFRGSGISPDDDRAVAFRLETSAERKLASGPFNALDYLPSGSVVDGLGAALLARCQVAGIPATLCATWPRSGGSAVSLVKSLVKTALPGLNESGDDGEASGFDSRGDRLFDPEIYT